MNQNVLRFGNYIILKLCILPGCVGPFRVDRSDIVSTCQVDALLFRRFNVSCYDRRSQAAMSQITLADFLLYYGGGYYYYWRVAWHYVCATLLQPQSIDRHISSTHRILESREDNSFVYTPPLPDTPINNIACFKK